MYWLYEIIIGRTLSDSNYNSIPDTGGYCIPINDTTFKLSVFWPSDTESQIVELRFSDSVSLSFKTRLTSVTCFCGDVMYSKFPAGTETENMVT